MTGRRDKFDEPTLLVEVSQQRRKASRVRSISPAPMSLHALLYDGIGELRAYHPDASIELDAHGELDGVWDRDRLRQVVANLVGNAIGHGLADSPVTVRSAKSGECVLLEVHNLGEPIPSEHLGDIFDPMKGFAQKRSTGGGHRGIGLGLFIVRAIAQAHGGSVAVVSSREDGTTFTVKLPPTAPTEKCDGNR